MGEPGQEAHRVEWGSGPVTRGWWTCTCGVIRTQIVTAGLAQQDALDHVAREEARHGG